MQLSKIDHTLLLASDLSEAKTYFEDILGARARYRDYREDTLIIEIGAVRFFVEQHLLAGQFPQHLSFAVEEIEPIKVFLKSKGIETTSGSVDFLQYNNYDWLEWIGPDGIRLECVAYKEQI